MHHSPRNGAFAPEIWADTEVSPPNIRVSSFRFAFPSASPRLRVSLISGLAPPSVLFDPLAPAQLALRANLWLVYLLPTHALDCVLGGQKFPLKNRIFFLHIIMSARNFSLSDVLDLNP